MFRRPRPELAPVTPVAPSLEYQLPEIQPIDPHAFITAHEQSLQACTAAWSKIAGDVQEREPVYRQHIRSGLIDVREAHGALPPDEETLERETDKLSAELTVYNLLTTRYISGVDNLVPLAQIKKYVQDIPDHTVHYILNKKDFPRRRFMAGQSIRVQKMRLADGLAHGVLGDLTATYNAQPQELTALADLYDVGAAEMDNRYRELQAMIATDWHRPDAQKSILKNFVVRLGERPDVFMPAFVREVAAAEKERKYLTIQDMARFAIVASGTDEVGQDKIAGLLASTYSKWSAFTNIDAAFQTYVQREIDNLSKRLAAIAGPRNLKSIRIFPTAEEVDRLKDHFAARHTPTRGDRRKRQRAEQKAKKTEVLPSPEDISQVANEAARSAHRKIMIAKNTPNGHIFTDASVEELVDGMKFSSNTGASDMKSVLAWLQSNTVSGASQRLKGTTGEKLFYNGKQLPLWRLAPNRIQELPISNRDGRRMRIVYAIIEDAVVIVDIMDHDAFDQKYGMG